MMIHTPEVLAESPMEKRLKQLADQMTETDLRAFLSSRVLVEEFLRLGRKWDFFELAPSETERAGRDILMNAFTPESLLASVIENNRSNLQSFEEEVAAAMKDNPKFLAEKLIDVADRLRREYSESNDTVLLGTQTARDELTQERDPKRFARRLTDAFVSSKVHPTWFQVIDRYQLAPSDIEALFQAFDNGSWKGVQVRIDRKAAETHQRIAGTTPDAVHE